MTPNAENSERHIIQRNHVAATKLASIVVVAVNVNVVKVSVQRNAKNVRAFIQFHIQAEFIQEVSIISINTFDLTQRNVKFTI